MTKLGISQYSRYTRTRHDKNIFAFCLFIDAKIEILSKIDEVLYALHPTFPEPIRRQKNFENCFALQSEAWGEFASSYEIHWKDGRTDSGEYILNLQKKSWPMRVELRDFSSSIEGFVYELLNHSDYEWRKVSTLADRASIELEEANNILISLGQKKAARKAYFQSIDLEDLWGSTSVVGLLPEPGLE